MDKESFGDFSCISISSDGNELEIGEYFDTPYFSEDKKALYIQPLCANDSSKLLLAPDGNQTTKNITVELNFTKNEKDCDGIALTGSSEHKYKINKNYGNIKKVTVLIRTVEGTGSFLSEGEKECTVGFSLGELTFNSNTSEYKFVGLEAVNKNNENISLSDSVSFEEIESDEYRGVYKYKVRVIEDTDDILIRPKSLELPKLLDIYPPFSPTGYDQDSTLKITFNKGIDESSFDSNYSFLSITLEDGTDLRKNGYFNTPVLSEDKKELSISTVRGKFIVPIDSLENTADIKVNLNFSNEKDLDGFNLPGTEDYTYRVSKIVDNLPPEIKTLRIAKTKEDAENGTNLITFEQFENYAKGSDAPANVKKHHVRTVWIYVEATDKGTGVSSFTVKEQYLRGTDGAVASIQSKFRTSYINDTNGKNFTNVFEHEFKSYEDGVVNLSFEVSDYTNKTSEYNSTVDVIKDTKVEPLLMMLDSDGSVKINETDSEYVTYTVPIIQKDSNSIKDNYMLSSVYMQSSPYITDLNGNEYRESMDPSSTTYFDKVEFYSVDYTYDDENYISIPLDNVTFKNRTTNFNLMGLLESPVTANCAEINITVEQSKDVFLRLTVKDSVGNTESRKFIINKAINILSCKYNNEKELEFSLDSKTLKDGLTYVCFDIEGEKTGTKPQYPYRNNKSYRTSVKLGSLYLDNSFNSTQIKDLPNDVYYVRCFLYSYDTSTEDCFYSTSYCGKTFVLKKTSDETIIPFSYEEYEDLVNNSYEYAVPTAADVPENFSVIVDPPVLNAATRGVHIHYPEGFTPNPKLTYQVHYYYDVPVRKVDELTQLMDLTLSTNYSTCNFEIIVSNTGGEKLTTSPKVVDLSYDNVSPYIGETYARYETTNSIFLGTSWIYDGNRDGDYGVGLYVNDEGNIPVQYYFSDEKYSYIDWDSDDILTTYYKPGDELFELPLDGYSGNYLRLQVTDKNGNTARDAIPISSGLNSKPQFTYSAPNYTIDCDDVSSLENCYLTVQYFDGDSWEMTDQLNKAYKDTNTSTTPYPTWDDSRFSSNLILMQKQSNKFTLNTTFTNTEENSFVRLFAWCRNTAHYVPVYGYLPYLRSPATYASQLLDYSEGYRGINILTDVPVLVHTFYCSRNLGDKAEDWLYFGTETGTVQNDSSFTYPKSHYDAVPKGKYYTTVIHFADGKLLMSQVKQK